MRIIIVIKLFDVFKARELNFLNMLVLVAQLRLHRTQVGAGLAELGVQVAARRLQFVDQLLARVEGFLHALHAGLPGVVDAVQLGGQGGHLLFQLRQALGLAGNLLQVAAGNPHGAAVLAAHLAVVALGAKQLDLLPGGEGADDAIAIGGTAAHESGQAVAHPARVAGRLLGLRRGAGRQQAAEQAGSDDAVLERGKSGGDATG